MSTLFFLILFPIVIALALLVFKNDAARGFIVRISALAIGVGAIYLVSQYFTSDAQYFEYENEMINTAMMVIEIALAIFIFVLGIKYKKYLASILVAIQAPLMVWFETQYGHAIHVSSNLFVDKLSLIMALIIGIIGSLITVYAIGYMKDFHHHHHEMKDRRPLFFFLMFIFLSAMFGIVFSNNLVWLYFFWEITTLCSFLLIGYTKTQEAINNSFRAIIMNLLGGLAFALAIVFMGIAYQTVELNNLLTMGMMGFNVVIPVLLLCFAGITKSAQMPFQSWLLGAMVAPTPTSALLHSSTMVKAGVYIIVKLAPVLGFNPAGIMVMMVGGITFVVASFIAISQSNAKKVLAYSTVANLGLIVTCGGIGSYEAVWAAILLIIFHAVAKSLLFLSVGTVEHNVGSRDIEDMDGLFVKMPKIAIFMVIGIAGMFIAPFGMLISKWAAMKAFIDSKNIILIMMIIFGSAATLFFWTKWLGKIIAVMSKQQNIEGKVHNDEWVALGSHAFLTIVVCLIFPLISSTMLEPYLNMIYGQQALPISQGNMLIMTFMLALVILLPLSLLVKNKDARIVDIYMAGANTGDNLTFQGSLGQTREASLKNWYMDKYFGEKKMALIGVLTSATLIVVTFSIILSLLIKEVVG